jgi:hypothetical protein
MTVNRMAVFILAVAGLVVLGFAPGTASAQNAEGVTRAKARPSTQSGQKSTRPRARTRIRVTPVYPYRLESSIYPVPYDYEYPGPNAVRQCTAWLATEYRLSGTVVVPRMRCWWERP